MERWHTITRSVGNAMMKELSEREKFIFHVGMIVVGNPFEVIEAINHVRKHRCRGISDVEAYDILEKLRMESITAKSIWEEE